MKDSKDSKDTDKDRKRDITHTRVGNYYRDGDVNGGDDSSVPLESVKLSAALDDEPESIKGIVGFNMSGLVLDRTPEVAEREMSRFESRYSELLMAVNALPLRANPDLYPVTIKNVVAKADTKCAVDLNKFRMATSCPTVIRNSILYTSTRFPCAKLALFETGKILCSGTRSVEDSKFAIKKVVRMMRRSGLKAKFSKYEIVTTISHVDAKFVIDIQSFYNAYTEYCTVNNAQPHTYTLTYNTFFLSFFLSSVQP